MTQFPASGRPQKDIRVKIDEDNYEKHVSDVNWPNPATAVTWRGGTPDAVVSDIAEGNEVCNITLIQAWDDPNSLCVFMFEHAGEKATISYKPHADSPFEVEAEITLMRPTIGGKTNQFNEATIACPSTTPKIAAPPAGA